MAIKSLRLTKTEAEGFYAVHRERPFFGELTDFMSSGKRGDRARSGRRDREMARNDGRNRSRQSRAGTIRKELGTSIQYNCTHGSTRRKPPPSKSAISSPEWNSF